MIHKVCFMQIESVLQTKNQSEPAKNRFSVALLMSASQLLHLSITSLAHNVV